MTPDETNLVVGTLIVTAAIGMVVYGGYRAVRWAIRAPQWETVLGGFVFVVVIGAWIMGVGLVLALVQGAARFWRSLF